MGGKMSAEPKHEKWGLKRSLFLEVSEQERQ